MSFDEHTVRSDLVGEERVDCRPEDDGDENIIAVAIVIGVRDEDGTWW